MSDLATRETGDVAVAALHQSIEKVMQEKDLDEIEVRAAVFGPWAKPYKEGGVAAIINGLLLCRRYGLQPNTDPPQVYVAQFKGGGAWAAFPSGHGMRSIANRLDSFDGVRMIRDEKVDDMWVVEVEVYRKGMKHPAAVATGFKNIAKFGDTHKARNAAVTHAERVAFTRAFIGVVPGLTAEAAAYLEATEPDYVGVNVDALPAGDDGEKASRKQLAHLFALVAKLGWDDTERRSRAGVASFKDLTSGDADRLIDEWTLLVESEPVDVIETLPVADEPVDLEMDAAVTNVEGQLGGQEVVADGRGALPSSPSQPPATATDREGLAAYVREIAHQAFPEAQARLDWLTTQSKRLGFELKTWARTATIEQLTVLHQQCVDIIDGPDPI